MKELIPFNWNRLAREFWEKGAAGDCPVYDMHGHMGAHYGIYFPQAEAENMVRALERINGKLVFSHHWPLFAPDFGNDRVVEIVRRYPERLRMYVGINPHYPEIVARDLKAFDSWRPWAVGLKILAGYHKVPVTDARYAPALEFADAGGLPVLFHTWGGCPFNGPGPLRQVIERYGNIRFILAHCFNGEWDEAVRIARDFPGRAYLELTSIPGQAGIVEKLVAGAGSACILYGTDLPWFDEYQAVGGVLGARISEEDVRNILYRNAQRLLPDF